MRGILEAAGYVPHHRLRREAVAEALGTRAPSGTRAVASYDEDTTTLGVEAARLVRRGAADVTPAALWFSTADPVYLDKTNAAAIHAALRLPDTTVAADLGGTPRSGVAALLAALSSDGPALVVTADVRTGLPGSEDEVDGGDAGAAMLVGSDAHGPLLAELVATGSATEEFVDRWRVPGEPRSRRWEDRFVASRYPPLAERAIKRACEQGGIDSADLDHVIVIGLHRRSVRAVRGATGFAAGGLVDDLTAVIGNAGTAHPGLLLADVLERARPDQLVALVSLADGADTIILRTTAAVTEHDPTRTVASQIQAGDDRLSYADFLTWRGMLDREPARRPDPARVSAPAAARRADWKLGFVGSRDPETGALHLPPATVPYQGGELRGGQDPPETMPAPMADVPATVRTFTADRVARSPAPPTVFAVLDFDGGGRYPCELTDVRAGEVAVGDRVEMTFRLVHVADGLRNYFWKARPLPSGSAT
ncbi:MAG: OB-fold domain-containing protein [Actinobacteria bacterium]|nr:OB-fold domain-containing protein [Actinomycetota bacterium]